MIRRFLVGLIAVVVGCVGFVVFGIFRLFFVLLFFGMDAGPLETGIPFLLNIAVGTVICIFVYRWLVRVEVRREIRMDGG